MLRPLVKFLFRNKRFLFLFVFFTCLVFILLYAHLTLGSSSLSLKDLFSGDVTAKNVLFNIRLPRFIGGFMVGMGLATSGAILQPVMHNPLAEPYILGLASGASLGAAISFIVDRVSMLEIFAFAGAFLTALIIFEISRTAKLRVHLVLLTGIAISILFSAILSFLMYIAGNKLHAIVFWIWGGLDLIQWKDLSVLFVVNLSGVFLAVIYSYRLNLIELGEETAISLGLDVLKTQRMFLLLSCLLTSVCVAKAGAIGFVGLMIPHIVRLALGSWDNRFVIPLVALTGGVFLSFCDLVAKLIISPSELPIGIITAFCGVPFFLYLLFKSDLFR